MDTRKVISLLKVLSEKKKAEYIAFSVKAKMLKRAMNEARRRRVLEAYEGGLGPSMDTGAPGVPSQKRFTGGRALPGARSADYPDPDILAGMMNANMVGSDDVVAFIGTPGDPASGPGSYAELLSRAESARMQAATADDFLQLFQTVYPKLSPDEQMKVRGGARKFVLGFKKGFGGGVK